MSCNSVFSFSPTNWVPIEEEEEEVSGGAERRRKDERQNLMMKLMRKCKGERRDVSRIIAHLPRNSTQRKRSDNV